MGEARNLFTYDKISEKLSIGFHVFCSIIWFTKLIYKENFNSQLTIRNFLIIGGKAKGQQKYQILVSNRYMYQSNTNDPVLATKLSKKSVPLLPILFGILFGIVMTGTDRCNSVLDINKKNRYQYLSDTTPKL